jgi:hypothetical protein
MVSGTLANIWDVQKGEKFVVVRGRGEDKKIE